MLLLLLLIQFYQLTSVLLIFFRLRESIYLFSCSCKYFHYRLWIKYYDVNVHSSYNRNFLRYSFNPDWLVKSIYAASWIYGISHCVWYICVSLSRNTHFYHKCSYCLSNINRMLSNRLSSSSFYFLPQFSLYHGSGSRGRCKMMVIKFNDATCINYIVLPFIVINWIEWAWTLDDCCWEPSTATELLWNVIAVRCSIHEPFAQPRIQILTIKNKFKSDF